MDDNLDNIISRRSFLRQGSCAALGLAGLSSQLLTSRSIAAALQGGSFDDYRALVCVFLFGGNDNGNTLIPIAGGDQNYADYAAQRGNLAIRSDSLAATTINPLNTSGQSFALHPALSGMKSLFDQGNAAMVANVGTLLAPTTRDQYRNISVALPGQLFAHEKQQEQWQLSTPNAIDGLGWGGKLADMLQASHTAINTNVSMNISIAGVSQFLSGRTVTPYVIGPRGAPVLRAKAVSHGSRDELRQAYMDMLAAQDDASQGNAHAMQQSVRDISRRALINNGYVNELLSGDSSISAEPPSNNRLARQLANVARLIEGAESGLGHNRQVFFVAMGGFDNHNGLLGSSDLQGPHAALLGQVDQALMYFWEALGQINKRDCVTTFTASDFGRTFASNGNGSDHGWGAHHIVMGGAQLQGARIFGQFPNILVDGPEDTGLGRFIPSTSVDQYGAEFARWMGVSPAEMSTVFPNIDRFQDVRDPSTHLGMLI